MHFVRPEEKGMNILSGTNLRCAAKCHMLQVHPLIAHCSVYSHTVTVPGAADVPKILILAQSLHQMASDMLF